MNYGGISLLSIRGKIYGRMLINMVKESKRVNVTEEQGGFRSCEG